jgi:hypothetical protein
MSPLGAMWGTDPGVSDSTQLKETVLNPRWTNKTPFFVANSLGLNGRLSGPIDDVGDRSSCMTCHMKAQWNTKGIDDTTPKIFSLLGSPEKDMSEDEKLQWMVNLNGTQAFCDADLPIMNNPCDSLAPGSAWIGMDFDFVMVAAAINSMQQKGKLKKENILVGKHH